MSKRMFGLLAAVLFIAVAVYAGDAWKDKDFQNWDQKDVQKILNDSPWSRQIQIGSSGGGTGADVPSGGSNAANSNVGPGSAGGGASAGGAGSMGGGYGGDGGGAGPVMNFVLRWYSSRTVREAVARQKELSGVAADEARKPLAEQMNTYDVVLQSGNMGMFVKEREDSLKDHSYLTLKNTKEKILPVNVTIQRGEGARPVAVIFEFLKKSTGGGPTISSDEKGAEFSTTFGTTTLKVSFDFSKMKDKQGLDL